MVHFAQNKMKNSLKLRIHLNSTASRDSTAVSSLSIREAGYSYSIAVLKEQSKKKKKKEFQVPKLLIFIIYIGNIAL